MKRLRVTVLCAAFVFSSGCGAAQPRDAGFMPAQGWILVREGSVTGIRDAILEYDGLARAVVPGSFRLELHPQADGAVAVLLPDGLPAYDLANMTGWLSAPPSQLDVRGASAWLAAPGGEASYFLQLEVANTRGDTLVGASSDGRSVRVYLPEGGLSETSAHHAYLQAPRISISSDPVRLQITLDTSVAFGNPGFVVDSPKDHSWGW